MIQAILITNRPFGKITVSLREDTISKLPKPKGLGHCPCPSQSSVGLSARRLAGLQQPYHPKMAARLQVIQPDVEHFTR